MKWGRNRVDPEGKTDYFDSPYQSAAVVGLNTSAFLDGGTIHFHYLLNVGGGLLHTARTLGDYFDQLNGALQAPERESLRSRHFVGAFIWPRGVRGALAPVAAFAALRAAEPLMLSAAPRP